MPSKGQGGSEGRDYYRKKEIWGDDEYVHCLDGGDFTGISMSKCIKLCT